MLASLGGWTILWVSAGVATFLVVVSIGCLIGRYGGRNLCARAWMEVGRGKWDFSKSWASNLTVLGAVLGTLLSAVSKELTSDEQLSVAGLNVSFGLFAVTAPVVFYALGHTLFRNTDWENADLHVEGRVWTFFLATWLTLWAVVGQLMTLGHLYSVLSAHLANSSFRTEVTPIGLTALGVALLALGVYAIRSMYWTVKWAREELTNLPTRQAAMFAVRQRYGITGPAQADLKPALSEWALL